MFLIPLQVIVLDEAAIAAANIIPDHDLFSGSTSELVVFSKHEHYINFSKTLLLESTYAHT